MKHRLINVMGLGNSKSVILDNNIKLKESSFWDKFFSNACENFNIIKKNEEFNFHADDMCFCFGIEPAYKNDEIFIICFAFENKDKCSIERGRAFGFCGTNCISKLKFYEEYKRKTKFINFIDNWFELVKKELQEEKIFFN